MSAANSTLHSLTPFRISNAMPLLLPGSQIKQKSLNERSKKRIKPTRGKDYVQNRTAANSQILLLNGSKFRSTDTLNAVWLRQCRDTLQVPAPTSTRSPVLVKMHQVQRSVLNLSTETRTRIVSYYPDCTGVTH